MKDVLEISEENLEDFLPLLGEDLSEDVKRIYFNGIGVLDKDGQAVGAFVYELLNFESEEDTRSRICLAKFGDKETRGSLEDYYSHTSVKEGEVVESFYGFDDEEEARALEESGFSLEKKEDEILTVTLSDLAATGLGKDRKLPAHVGSIESLSALQYRNAVKQILFKGHTGIMEDMPFLPKSWFDNKISACISSGGRFPGLFLIRRTPSGILIPALYFSYGPKFQKNLLYMLRYSVQQALKLYPPETKIKIVRNNMATKALTDKLLPNSPASEIFFGTRREQ